MDIFKTIAKIFGIIPREYTFRCKLHDPNLIINKRLEDEVTVKSRSINNALKQVTEIILLKHPQFKCDLNIELINSN